MNLYRVGHHQPQNLYRGDEYIGVLFDPADTARIANALNNEKILAQPNRTTIYRVEYAQPRCLYRHDVFLGVLFSDRDAALVARVMNVMASSL
jgi:hypothetical protein